MQVKDTLYIGGEWVKPAGDELIEVISPHTEDVIATVPDGTPEDMDRAVEVLCKHPALQFGVVIEIRPIDEEMNARWEAGKARLRKV